MLATFSQPHCVGSEQDHDTRICVLYRNPGLWGSMLCPCGGGGQERSGEPSAAEEPGLDE